MHKSNVRVNVDDWMCTEALGEAGQMQPEQSSIIDSSGTKWSLVQTGDNEVTMTQDPGELSPSHVSGAQQCGMDDVPPKRLRRVACTCPNCREGEK